ncbi:uncharacterized protein GGS22DRAFT_199566 [Annulohypoxylon maeteangense]|uniref:uncharacterized protein n=1 Tax=Annulohypoxylon maeteangense TaxID=1927788 RepID=UPI0020074D1F|nr:uncharacterized protein GGS22DRAFT_199566 [Annulohypoxylon maeteangense]KAI0886282.1 hypothetical protein GGS22DRAFT_199566 [Annulohypoxylon maeteangense]
MRFSVANSLAWFCLAQISISTRVSPRSPSTETHPSPGTVISFPNSSAFHDATERWTVYKPPSYSAAISPTTEEDVVNAVKLAKRFNTPFLATGGRHGYSTTLAKMQGGIAIDLSKMNSVKIDRSAKTLTVGPGVRFRDIFDLVFEAGFQIQTGACSCVGMLGATLGGGIGRLHGLDGMIIDALQSVRLVTANAEIVEASEHSNPELFWGIRGAGFNFGIVVSATYRLHPLYNRGIWTNADLLFPPEKNVTYFDAVAKMLPLPPQLAVATSMGYNITLNKPQLSANLMYAGPRNEAIKAMDPLLKLGPSYSNIKEITWNKVSKESNFLLDAPNCEDGQILDSWSVNLRNVSAPALVSSFNDMASFFQKHPSARASGIILETWPIEATVATPDNATAFPWRETATYVMIQMKWDNSSDPVKGPANDFARTTRSNLAANSGFGGLAVYVNYAYGDETPQELYGESKLPRLVELKKKYDPTNAFRFYNALPTTWPLPT